MKECIDETNLIKNDLGALFKFVFSVTIAVSVLSQMSEFEYIFRPLMYVMWVFMLCYLVIVNGFVLRLTGFTLFFVVAYLIYFCYCLVLTFFGTDHIHSFYLKLLLVPILCCVVTDLSVDCYGRDDIFHSLIISYEISSLILALYINVNFFVSYDRWVSNNGYLFAQKNSASQILGVAALLSFFICRNSSKISKVTKFALFVLSIYFILIIALSKCRAVLLALCCVAVVNFFINVKHKILYLIACTIIVVVCVQNSTVSNFIVNSLNLNSYDGDINRFSSNRIDLWKKAIEVFSKNVMFGVGNYYVDNSYLSILAESGILGFIVIESIWLTKVIGSIGLFKIDRGLGGLLLCLTVFYLVESLFEAFPPFGPGISIMFFWCVGEVLSNKNYIV